MPDYESPDGSERVVIGQRSDGYWTFELRHRSYRGKWVTKWSFNGIYDSAETAEDEARAYVPWLKTRFRWGGAQG